MANPRQSASTIVVKGGTAEVKAYPLTEDELTTLGVIQGGAALFFTFAGACFGFWVNVGQQLAFAGTGTSQNVMTQWHTLRDVALVLAIACALIGAGLFVYNGFRVRKIKKRTAHV